MSHSEALFERAKKILVGGVNSPVRAFRAVGGSPRFFERGQGPYVWDVDGKRYIDFIGSWGPLILGHTHPEVIEAVVKATAAGTTFGAPTEAEIALGELVASVMPSIERVRFVSSGTEATMSAVRLARGFTGRDRIVKIDGGYHGHADGLLVDAGSGVATLAIAGSAGVPKAAVENTLVVPFGDLEAAQAIFAANKGVIAAMILEPVQGNVGVIAPPEGYLEGLRKLCTAEGSLLIFDEVMTGFRVAYGGAQGRYGVTPDLTCLGKIVGGGLPAAAFGGRADIMAKLAPEGPVYQAGTLSGNPLAMAAGHKTLELLGRPGVYEQLDRSASRLAEGLAEALGKAGTVAAVGSMMTAFFSPKPTRNYTDAKAADRNRYGRFFHGLLERGVYFPPSQFEALFVSLAHDDAVVAEALAAVRQAVAASA